MSFKIVFATVLLVLVYVTATPLAPRSIAPQKWVPIIAQEESCAKQGGMCVRISQCKPGNLVQFRGVFCPKQKHLDVECCYMD